MEYPPRAQQIARFGVFEVDLAGGELRKHGLKISLQEQPFRLLTLLLERHGEVVSREELRQALWPEDTFVDFEHGLNTAIKKLRQALGDAACQPRYIATHYKRGYRFIAPVEDPVETENQQRPDAAPARGRPRMLLLAFSAVLFTLMAAVASWWRGAAPEPASTVTPVPLTSYPGMERHPSFSPDGNRVAFSWNGPNEDNFDIYVKEIGSDAYLRLTSDPEDDEFPAWSPDGRNVAFLRAPASQLPFNMTPGQILLVPALGGAERKIAPARVRGPLSWLPDGQGIVISDKIAPEEPVSLFLLAVPSGERRRLSWPSHGTESDLYPAVSPDGRMVVFRRGSYWNGPLFLIKLSAGLTPEGEPQRLTATRVFSNPVWSSDGHEIVFQIARSRRYLSPDLWKIKVPTDNSRLATPERLEWSEIGAEEPAISRTASADGPGQQRLAFTKSLMDNNIYRLEIPVDSPAPRRATPLIASTSNDEVPRYSPDGERVSFTSLTSGTTELWVSNSDGSHPMQLTHLGFVGCPRWSPDGELLVFDSTAAGNFDVYVMDSRGGQPERLTFDESADAVASWSHDGQWIYFTSNRTGRFEIWKMRPDGTKTIQVTRHGGHVALESLDRQWVYYAKEAFATSLWKVPVVGGEETQILESVVWLSFDVTKDGIYFVPANLPYDNPTINFLSFATSAVRVVATIQGHPGMRGMGLSVSPDGRSILFVQNDYLSSDLMLVENFH